jgi:hypothetical protein
MECSKRNFIVSLRTIQKALICRQFWIVRKLTMTDAEVFSNNIVIQHKSDIF